MSTASKLWNCPICAKVMLKKNLYTHLRVVHKLTGADFEEIKASMEPSTPRTTDTPFLYCPVCDEGFNDHLALARHCDDNHSEDGANGKPQDYSTFMLTFDSDNEFKVWLDSQSQRTGSSFYKRSSYAGGKSYSLRCNRAGTYEKSTISKATSSKKDVISCSCFLNVHTKEDNRVEVSGCFGHIGHDVEPALLRLTETQEQILKGLLEEHSMDYILRRLKKDYSAKDSRLYFVDRHDLWNLTYKFGLRPGYLDRNDMNSLMLREAEHNPDDGIRILSVPSDEPSGKGFCLVVITPTQVEWLRKYSSRGISVDDTHNVTKYNLKLATVSVADQKDRGLPAAFLLSGTMTASDVQILFTEIAKVVPDFDPKQIVTDEAPSFYNGFRATFPNSNAKLHYCRWHLDQTFKRATTRMVEARLRGRVNKDLRELLLITDLGAFELKFAQIIAYLEVEGQGAMANYLKENYLGRTASWASFANQDAVLDTTMISERWHLRLKKDFLQRNANSRADFLVDLLIRAVEDLAESTEIRDRRRLATASYRVQQTTKCHRWAMKHYAGKPERISLMEENKWQVQGRDAADYYIVHLFQDCMCAESVGENVHCPLCNACPYSWRCSCLDNRAGISCLHIHAVKLYGGPQAYQLPSPAEAPEAEELGAPEVEPSVIHTLETGPSTSQVVTQAQERRQERSQLRSDIESKFSVITAHVNILVNTDTEQSMDSLKEIYELVDRASTISLRTSISEPYLAVRPELAKPGGKPLLTKAELYTRSQYRKKMKQTRDE